MLTAGDVYTYTACPRWTYLDQHGDRRRRSSPSEFTQKLQADGRQWQSEVLESLDAHAIEFDGDDVGAALARTRDAMRRGLPRIAGAVFAATDEHGRVSRLGIVDLLERVPGRSEFGRWSYEPVEIKTARRVKSTYRLQLAFYADLLARALGRWPRRGHLILGDGRRESFLLSQHRRQFEALVVRLERVAAGAEEPIHVCAQCNSCPWRGVCLPEALAAQNISLVYGLQRAFARRLQARGILTCAQLAAREPCEVDSVLRCGAELAGHIVGQARSLERGHAIWRRSPRLPAARREIFFDIEGDPDHDALYLFGLLIREGDRERHLAFLAERPEEEERAFTACARFLESLPEAPIYHYHHYERSALGRLVDRHGFAPGRVEALRARLVDLSEAVTDACFLPVTSYSLKTVARYLGFEWSRRDSSAVQSVVWFASWLKTGDRELLDQAVEYNADDCRATRVLKDWLADGPEPDPPASRGERDESASPAVQVVRAADLADLAEIARV